MYLLTGPRMGAILLTLVSLVVTGSASADIGTNAACRALPESAAPAWVVSPLPDDDTYLYGYGVAGEAEQFNDMLSEASQHARKELAESLSVNVKSSVMLNQQLVTGQSQAEMNEAIDTTLSTYSEMILHKAQVRGRWLNYAGCQLWVQVGIRRNDYDKVQKVAESDVMTRLNKLEKKVDSVKKDTSETVGILKKDPNVILREHNLQLDDHSYYVALQLNMPRDQFDSVMDLYDQYQYNFDKSAFYFPINAEFIQLYQRYMSYLGGNAGVSLLDALIMTHKLNEAQWERLLGWAKSRKKPLNTSVSINNLWAMTPDGCSHEGCLASDLLKYRHHQRKAGDQYAPIHFAAIAGPVVAMKMLVKQGADIQGRTTKGYTPLALAIEAGNTAVADWLISRPASWQGDQGTAIEVAMFSAFKGFDHHSDNAYWAENGDEFAAGFTAQVNQAMTYARALGFDGQHDLIKSRVQREVKPLIASCDALIVQKKEEVQMNALNEMQEQNDKEFGFNTLEQAQNRLTYLQGRIAYYEGRKQPVDDDVLKEYEQAKTAVSAISVREKALAAQGVRLPESFNRNVVPVCAEAHKTLAALLALPRK